MKKNVSLSVELKQHTSDSIELLAPMKLRLSKYFIEVYSSIWCSIDGAKSVYFYLNIFLLWIIRSQNTCKEPNEFKHRSTHKNDPLKFHERMAVWNFCVIPKQNASFIVSVSVSELKIISTNGVIQIKANNLFFDNVQ